MSNFAQRNLEGIFLTVFHAVCRVYRPLRSWIGACVLGVFFLMTAAVVQIFPVSNWDMFAYTAVVLEGDTDDVTALHRQSYSLVRDNVTEGEFITLTEDRPYRVRQARDAEAFHTMLGFYRLKVLYVETARLLADLAGPVEALRMISMMSALAIGVVLLAWLARTGTLMYGPVVAAFLMLSTFGYAALLITPDLYATFFLVLAAFFYVEKLDIPAALTLVAAFLTRPDHLAFIGVFFVFAAIYGPGRWIQACCFAACLVTYLWITRGSDHPGWWIHMWFTHIEYAPTLKDFKPAFSIGTYLEMLMRSTVRSLMGFSWIALLFALILFFAKCVVPDRMDQRSRVLLYAVFASICAKYLVFPHYETRFYLPYLIIMGMILLVGWHRQQISET